MTLPPRPSRRAPRSHDDRGVAATTLAAVFPAVLVLTMLAVQAGMYYHAQHRAAAAADEAVAAARFAENDAAGIAAAESFLAGAPLADSSIAPSGNAEEVRFTVSGTVEKVVPLPVTFSVSATAAAPRERFVPEPERQ